METYFFKQKMLDLRLSAEQQLCELCNLRWKKLPGSQKLIEWNMMSYMLFDEGSEGELRLYFHYRKDDGPYNPVHHYNWVIIVVIDGGLSGKEYK
jgi:hypothetical protein